MATPDLNAMTGLELMRWVQTERPTDIPSIGRLVGMRFDEVEHGRVVVSLDTRPPTPTGRRSSPRAPSSTPAAAPPRPRARCGTTRAS
ncbi:hypothetical protein [Streptomyces laurentii]|uniref:hypothetical protein n=1 Tax=Streptomyces laurentii TaxID=39478 RepID=UPI0033CE6EC9